MTALGVIFLIMSYHLCVHQGSPTGVWLVVGVIGVVCMIIGRDE